mmetsp:Transcript_59697/g.155289  ORF Transcript_59697/g.155289 Transcript_59697/m.155289 type:complete len:581 (+) Transcript_59697:64-1806(+)
MAARAPVPMAPAADLLVNRKEYDALVAVAKASEGEEVCHEEVAHRPPPLTVVRRVLAGGALLAAAVAFALLCAGVARSGTIARGEEGLRQGPLRVASSEVEVKAQVFTGGRCGKKDEDTDYVLWGPQWGKSLDHIPDPEMCCAMCQGVPQCQSWTWIKDAGLDGCPSQCWMKSRRPDKKVHGKSGYVSGLPPPRPPLRAAPPRSAGLAEASGGSYGKDNATNVGGLLRGGTRQAVQDETCSKIERDTDYQAGDNLNMVPNIMNAWKCCEECHAVARCRSWTWGKARAEDEHNSVCYLKSAIPKKSEKKSADGLVSGLPGKRHETEGPKFDMEAVTVVRPGSIYCFSLIMPKSYEQELMETQHSLNAGIFACDEAAVYSNMTLHLASGLQTGVVDSDLKCVLGGDAYTALNTWIFIAVWRKVVEDGRYLYHDWTVKVDADSVFFPDRLSVVLQDHKGGGFINNCKYGLHGPIEVLSRAAVATLAEDYAASFDGKSPKKCVEGLHFGTWGEDVFLDRCLHDVLKLPRGMDDRLMCEAHCDCPDWYWCKNGTSRVVFHPFKRPDLYRQCMANALDGQPLLVKK